MQQQKKKHHQYSVIHFVWNVGLKGSHPYGSRSPWILYMSAYFGVVEAQGQGTLYVHMLLWLEDASNVEDMHKLLETESFQEWIQNFIQANTKVHMDGLDKEIVKHLLWETQLTYSCPPNPDDENWVEQLTDKLHWVVCSQQIHTCTWMICLYFNKYGQLVCKCCAPWELSVEDEIKADSQYKPQRRIAYMNNFCPSISVILCCNNDIKLLTNGSDMKHCMWYLTSYQSKKQGKNHKVLALTYGKVKVVPWDVHKPSPQCPWA